jgi:hypothetical protein
MHAPNPELQLHPGHPRLAEGAHRRSFFRLGLALVAAGLLSRDVRASVRALYSVEELKAERSRR